MRWWHVALSAWLAVAAAQDDEPEFELRQLTDGNFKGSISQGLWLVEHFSPKCSHCRAFAPTWTQLAEDKQHLERLAGFHMAQVNCLAQGDLCNANGIRYYPQLVLYSDGQALPAYSGGRSYDELSGYIDEQSTLYAQGASLGAEPSEEAEERSPAVVSEDGLPNPQGLVQEVDGHGLEAIKNAGPVLVEFYAPWCGHCKKLLPIYEQLAESLKGQLNIVAVDCVANAGVCKANGVMGYPTIRLFHHGTRTEYTGARTLDKMREFALKSVDPIALRPIKADSFDAIVDSEEAFFLYLQNFDTTVEEVAAVKAVLKPLVGAVPAFTSSDPLLYAKLSVANPPPTSILLAFSSHSPKPIASLSLPADETSLRRFIDLHRFPTLTHLSGKNYVDIMKSDTRALVVLGALHSGPEGEQERFALEKIARAWKRGGRPFAQPVWFVWVEGEKWKGWLRQSYGIHKTDLPALVVVDPPMGEYYDMTIEGTPVTFDGAAAFSVLEGVYQHFLRPKKIETALEWGSRSAALGLIGIVEWAVSHPFYALGSLLTSVGVFVYLLQRCVARDMSHLHGHGNYGGEKGGSRLD
ncbi:hypothetical protein Q5752_005797 [Cryptotrichosporon argae]